MQEEGAQRANAAGEAFARMLGFTEGGRWIFVPLTATRRARGFNSFGNQVAIHAPNGMVFRELIEAVAVAEERYGCRINLAPLYQLLDGGPEAMELANQCGLPRNSGWAVKHVRNSRGTILRVLIWSPRGMYYESYHVLQNFEGINIFTITDPWFLGRRQAAEDVNLPEGWVATEHGFTSPQGDTYHSLFHAFIVLGDCRPLSLVIRELTDYVTIVKETSDNNRKYQVMSSVALGPYIDMDHQAIRKLLKHTLLKPQHMRLVCQFLDSEDRLLAAARQEGVTNVDLFQDRMTAALQARTAERLYIYDLPEPDVSADRPDNYDPAPEAAADPVDGLPGGLPLQEGLPLPADVAQPNAAAAAADPVNDLPPPGDADPAVAVFEI